MEDFEKLILSKIKAKTGKVLFIPVDIWVNLIMYSESIEDYITCSLLMNMIDIVSLQTFREFIEEDDEDWYQRQKNKC